MIRLLAITLVVCLLGGCQLLEQIGPGASDPLPPPATQVPRFSPSIEIPPPVY